MKMQDLKLQDTIRKKYEQRLHYNAVFVVLLNTQQCDALGVNDYLLQNVNAMKHNISSPSSKPQNPKNKF